MFVAAGVHVMRDVAGRMINERFQTSICITQLSNTQYTGLVYLGGVTRKQSRQLKSHAYFLQREHELQHEINHPLTISEIRTRDLTCVSKAY
ncbi:hypothetical protein E2C01_036396 [Portunus trituberculatus]|uniref:Uncharacterized protein n=1 Tax=Portunus trituberculatus TaxID=210409 RepID=A0A5B7FE28_PORTR|nr:hypothetical protein [Portunus trituberculatus]